MNTNNLPQVSKEHLDIFMAVSREIEPKVIEALLEKAQTMPDFGNDPASMIKSGYHFAIDMLESIMSVGAASLLDDQVQWAQDRLPIYGVPREFITMTFTYYMQVFGQALPEATAKLVLPYFEWVIYSQREA